MLKFVIGAALGLFVGAYIAVSFPVVINNLFAEVYLAPPQ